jgi:type I restriction enzyme S subunit
MVGLRPNPDLIHPPFLALALIDPRTQEFLNQRTTGMAESQVNFENVALLAAPIWLPPLNEQEAIAEALSDADSAIEALDALITKKRDVKQAAMQQLLTGRTRLSGFQGHWESSPLGNLGQITGAGVDKKTYQDETPVRLVNYLDVYRNSALVSGDFSQWVSARPDQVKRCAIRSGDVLFTPTSETPGDICRSSVAIEDVDDAVYSYHVVRLRFERNWDLSFKRYAFSSKNFMDQASRAAEGSGTRYVITLPRFRALEVRFPTEIREQAAIGEFLADLDAEIGALDAKRDKMLLIKQGMMQELLTGRVRLV